MKLQIDTENKIIKIEELINLNDLFITLNELLPNDKWKEFKLDKVSQISDFTFPIIIKQKEYIPYYVPTPYKPFNPDPLYPNYPWYGTITAGNIKAETNRDIFCENFQISERVCNRVINNFSLSNSTSGQNNVVISDSNTSKQQDSDLPTLTLISGVYNVIY